MNVLDLDIFPVHPGGQELGLFRDRLFAFIQVGRELGIAQEVVDGLRQFLFDHSQFGRQMVFFFGLLVLIVAVGCGATDQGCDEGGGEGFCDVSVHGYLACVRDAADEVGVLAMMVEVNRLF